MQPSPTVNEIPAVRKNNAVMQAEPVAPVKSEGAIMGFFSGLFGKKEEEKAATAPTVGGRRKRTAKKRSAIKTRKNRSRK